MFATLARYEQRLGRAEITQIECLRILKKLELEADRVEGMVREIVGHLDDLSSKILESDSVEIPVNHVDLNSVTLDEEKQQLSA